MDTEYHVVTHLIWRDGALNTINHLVLVYTVHEIDSVLNSSTVFQDGDKKKGDGTLVVQELSVRWSDLGSYLYGPCDNVGCIYCFLSSLFI